MSSMTHNRLLDSLPEDVQAKLLPRLEAVTLPLAHSIFETEERPKYVHFLTDGIASVVTTMEDGQRMEVGIVGREGFPERIHLLGSQQANLTCCMQVAGAGLRMPFQPFQELFLSTPSLLTAVLQFLQADTLTLSQLTACNRLHELEARLARWLLMVQDRTGSDELELTQEFLAQMLGTRRSTVNLAAGTLQRAGVIAYARGRIQILSRKALEGIACECYPAILNLFQTLYA